MDYFRKIINRASEISRLNPDKSVLFVDSAFKAINEPGIGDYCEKYFYKYHYFLEDKKSNSNAEGCIDSILALLKDVKLKQCYSNYYILTFFYKGDVYMNQNMYRLAFKSYFDGRRYIRQSQDTCLYYEYSHRLGMVSYKQEHYTLAANWWKKSISEFEICHKEDDIYKFKKTQADLDNIGLSYDHANNSDSALKYFYKALKYIKTEGIKYPEQINFVNAARGVVEGNLGTALYNTGDTVLAEKLFRQSIGINYHKGFAIVDAQLTQAKLIDLLIQKGKLDEAYDSLLSLRHSLYNTKNKPAELSWNKLMSDYFKKAGQPERTYPYLNAYINLKDSLEEPIKKLAGADINDEFENLDQSYKYKVLNKENELKTLYLTAAIVILLMAFLILVLLYNNTKRTQKHVAELKRFNEKTQAHNTELMRALNSLEDSQKDNSRILNIVAHDLRNPIAAIISITDLLQMEKNNNAEQKELLDLIRKSSDNLIDMISDLLHINITSDKIKAEPVELDQLISHCINLYQVKLTEKKQQIKFDAVPVTILADQEKIWRVMSNLLINAIKFSPENSLIEIKMSRDNDHVLIEIKDHGIGIPDGLKENIFKIYSGAGRTGTSGEKSFGLGLSISRQIIDAHHGRIWFESEVNKGTTFYVELPLVQENL